MSPTIKIEGLKPKLNELPSRMIDCIVALGGDIGVQKSASLLIQVHKLKDHKSLACLHNQYTIGTVYKVISENQKVPIKSEVVALIASAALFLSNIAENTTEADLSNLEITAELIHKEEAKHLQSIVGKPTKFQVKTPELAPFDFLLDSWKSWKECTYHRLSAWGLRSAIEDEMFAAAQPVVDQAVFSRILEALAKSNYGFDVHYIGDPSTLSAYKVWSHLVKLFEASPVLTAEIKAVVKEFNELTWMDSRGSGTVKEMYSFYNGYQRLINHLNHLNRQIEKQDDSPNADAQNITTQAKEKFLELCNKDTNLVAIVTDCKKDSKLTLFECFGKVILHMSEMEDVPSPSKGQKKGTPKGKTTASVKEGVTEALTLSEVQAFLSKNGYMNPKKRVALDGNSEAKKENNPSPKKKAKWNNKGKDKPNKKSDDGKPEKVTTRRVHFDANTLLDMAAKYAE
jgi:hypothetical protein